MKSATKRTITGYLFIAPWLLGFLIFTVGPLLASFFFSFTRYDLLSKPVWIGVSNYKSLLTDDPLFWKSLWVTLRYGLVAVPLGTACAVILALFLNLNVKGIAIFRTIFFLPSIVPTVASSMVFIWLLNPQIGLINGILRNLGIVGPAWLNDARWAPWTLVFLALWGVGGSMVIYLAGLKDIPTYLYEAAIIDGASTFRRMWQITLPMLTPVIFFNVVMGVIGAFQYFTQAYILTQGGPEESTTFYALYLFNRAWRYLDMGYASAMAWILFVIVIGVTTLLFRTQSKWVHYGG